MRRRAPLRFFTIAAVLVLVSQAREARAYRPFDGTDSDVANEGEFELELGPVQYLRHDHASYVLAPAAILNLGIVHDIELVVDTRTVVPNMQRSDAPRFEMGGQDVLMKFVLMRQEEIGIGSAVEAGMLLPGIHNDEGFGASADLIVSHEWKPLTIHLNNEIADNHEHRTEWLSTLIFVGPNAWPLRPVSELYVDHVISGDTQLSALFGAIWSPQESIDVDAAFREARTIEGVPEQEVRLGFTWRLDIWGKKEEN